MKVYDRRAIVSPLILHTDSRWVEWSGSGPLYFIPR